jgi:NAD(P)-dependent dehydrogenase (short-subunit alcohol dehydrogenase family)
MRAVVDDQGLPRGALSGRVAVVVGGASGIGRTVAKALAQQGARIVIADFDAARLERTLDEIVHLGSADAALALPTDVRNDASVRSLAADAVKAMGQVDILINMAGVLLQGPVDRIKPADWKWMLDTNLLGPVRTAMAFLPHLTERGSGHVINTVSAGALTPSNPLTIAYDTGQVALASFTKSLAAALSETGVHVSLYCTGSGGPRIGQNTRSRGLGRLLHPAEDLEEGTGPSDHLVDSLVDALRTPRFLILSDASASVPSMELLGTAT